MTTDLPSQLKFNPSNGLIPVIVQNIDSGKVLMQAFANKEALEKTKESKKAYFYSRSRKKLWMKGESSGNLLEVISIHCDCDWDSIIYLVKPKGPTCHTGSESCFFKPLKVAPPKDENKLAQSTLFSLETTIENRKTSNQKSWTKKLLENPSLLKEKIQEEALELCDSLEEENRENTIHEMADLLYHSMVLCSLKDVKLEEVFEKLRARFGTSGIEEKQKRNK